jgi:hypothetical protein
MEKYRIKFYSCSRYNKRIAVKLNYINSDKTSLLKHTKIPIRPFSTTSIRKGDPLGTTGLAIGSSYSSSLLSSPFGVTFIAFLGMGACLLCAVTGFPGFVAQNPESILVMPQLENILFLFENFLGHLRNMITILSADLSNFSPELLASVYLLLKEFITIVECAFISLDDIIVLLETQSLPGIDMDRIQDILEELRLQGNTIMMLARQIETRLNISEQERIPRFWFED